MVDKRSKNRFLNIFVVKTWSQNKYITIKEYYSRSEYGDAAILREYKEGIDVYPYYLPQYNISPDEIGIYIDNIIRLNLIECPSDKHFTDINWYRMYYDDKFMQELRNKIEIRDGYELVQIPKVFAPTSFGKKFYEVCVE